MKTILNYLVYNKINRENCIVIEKIIKFLLESGFNTNSINEMFEYDSYSFSDIYKYDNISNLLINSLQTHSLDAFCGICAHGPEIHINTYYDKFRLSITEKDCSI